MSKPRRVPAYQRMATELQSVAALTGAPPIPITRMTDDQLDAWHDRVRAARVRLGLPVNHQDYEPTRNTYDDNEEDED